MKRNSGRKTENPDPGKEKTQSESRLLGLGDLERGIWRRELTLRDRIEDDEKQRDDCEKMVEG